MRLLLLKNLCFVGWFICLLFYNRCVGIQPINGIEILKGKNRFNREFANLKDPMGVLPETFISQFTNGNLSAKDPANWDEFFVYDRQNTLLILSSAPMYFLKIESDQFYYHLETERRQIVRGLSGTNKKASSLGIFREVGDFMIGLYFTPTELGYAKNSRKIESTGSHRPRPHVWRLLEASNEATVYLPEFEETQLLGNLKFDVQQKKSRFVYTKKSLTSELGPRHVINTPHRFSFMMGKALRKTNCLLDSPSFLRPADEFQLIQDFVAFFSVSLGNARQCSSTGSPTTNCPIAGTRRDFLDTNDGVVVLYRGDLGRFEDFFSKDGFNLIDPKRKLSSTGQKFSYNCPAPKK